MGKQVLVDLKKANIIYAILQLLLTFIFFIIKINVEHILSFKIRWYMIVYIIFIVFSHEGLHGIGFKFIGKAEWKDINYGIQKKYLNPYCTCKNLFLTKGQYIGTMLLPNIVLSILSIMIMIKSRNLFWTLIAGLVIASGTGDYYMIYLVSKYPKGTKFMDHPTEPGFYVIE